MKIFLVAITCFLGLVATASASGFEYHRMIAGIHLGECQIGIANFKHINTGEIQGKLLFEPLGAISLPVSGEIAFSVCSLMFLLTGGLIYFAQRHLLKNRAEQGGAPNAHPRHASCLSLRSGTSRATGERG